jgi:2-oxoglutarate/2-oxoacid ferredoxin oxidoreductase subunit beta
VSTQASAATAPVSSDCQRAEPQSFKSGLDVKWCPGCGDHAILSQVLKLLPKLGIAREKLAFVSGIGCSSRFPYYLNTYGFHGIHGRAPAIATGLRAAQPDLSVWVVTGDGDSLSIGTNHLIHALRRNMDLKILLFNNHIYGLTKGQYSPTSEFGKKTKSSPFGTIEQPISPIQLALAAQATFAARTVFADLAHMGQMLEAVARHKGAAFLEIMQNCLVFNAEAFGEMTAPATRDEVRILLEHGKPITFGKTHKLGLALRGVEPEIVKLDENPDAAQRLLVHDAHAPLPFLAQILSSLEPPRFPTALGIFRDVEKPTYEDLLFKQIAAEQLRKPAKGLNDLLDDGASWEVQ